MAASRFAVADERQISTLEKKSKNENTTSSTKTWLRTFEVWARSRNVIPELSLYTPVDLNNILRRFYSEVRKENGNDYEPDSLRVMQA